MIEAVYWQRQHANHMLLREALALLRLIAARLEPTGTSPTPTSPPSSSSPTVTPSEQRGQASTSRPSVLRQALTRIAERFGREAIVSILMWAAGRLIPAAVAWLTLGRPALRWLESAAKWLFG